MKYPPTLLFNFYKKILSAFCFFCLLHPIYYPRTTLSPSLPVSSNSDPGSHSGTSSPLPTTVRAFIYRDKNSARVFFLSSIASNCTYYPRCKALSVDPFFALIITPEYLFCKYINLKVVQIPPRCVGIELKRTNASSINSSSIFFEDSH